MQYTVKGGDSLSQILKNYGVSSYASPATWALVKTASGSPSLIRPGEVLDLAPVAHLMPGYRAPAPAPAPVATPSQKLAQEISKYVPTKEAFYKKFGTEQELIPRAAIEQFAEQQVNPQFLRGAVRDLARYDMVRGSQGSGARRSGYGDVERASLLDTLEAQKKTMAQEYIGQQMDLFNKWYADQYSSYQLAEDPKWVWNTAGLGGLLGGSGYTPTKQAGSARYNPLDLRGFLTTTGPSGYQQVADYDRLYGTIT